MTDPDFKTILKAITERRRSILPPRIYNVLNALNVEADGIVQACKWIVHLMEGKCIVFSGPIGSGKTVSAAFMACYWTWLAACRPVYEALKADPEIKGDSLRIMEEAIHVSHHRARFKWVVAKEVIQIEWHELDSGYEGLLIIENLGREYWKPGSDYAPCRWDDLFDIRYSRYLPTIITTNLTPTEFKTRYGKHNGSRLREWGIWTEIVEEDMRI